MFSLFINHKFSLSCQVLMPLLFCVHRCVGDFVSVSADWVKKKCDDRDMWMFLQQCLPPRISATYVEMLGQCKWSPFPPPCLHPWECTDNILICCNNFGVFCTINQAPGTNGFHTGNNEKNVSRRMNFYQRTLPNRKT